MMADGLLVVAGVLPTQPPRCVIAHPVPIREASGLVFTIPCWTCRQTGCVPSWLRRKIAGPSFEELQGATVDPHALVECPHCDGQTLIEWDPFRERAGCAVPAHMGESNA